MKDFILAVGDFFVDAYIVIMHMLLIGYAFANGGNIKSTILAGSVLICFSSYFLYVIRDIRENLHRICKKTK